MPWARLPHAAAVPSRTPTTPTKDARSCGGRSAFLDHETDSLIDGRRRFQCELLLVAEDVMLGPLTTADDVSTMHCILACLEFDEFACADGTRPPATRARLEYGPSPRGVHAAHAAAHAARRRDEARVRAADRTARESAGGPHRAQDYTAIRTCSICS